MLGMLLFNKGEMGMSEVPSLLIFGVPFAVLLVVVSMISIMFRRVVSTNMVHIVQSRRKT